MTLEDLGNLGEFIGAFAVVVSLVYLAIQIRQNTAQMRDSSQVDRFAAMPAFRSWWSRQRDSFAFDPDNSATA